MNITLLETILAIIRSLLTLIVGSNPTIPANTTESPHGNSNLTPKPEEGVQDLINQGCQQFERISSEYGDLRMRECMCDEYCATYKDCCLDSSYYNESQNSNDTKFACSYMPFYGFIYTMSKCPSNYSNHYIVNYCETSNATKLVEDIVLTIPVVNQAKKITYKNIFCAFCHDDTQVEFWKVTLHCELMQEVEKINSNDSSSLMLPTPDFDNILDNLKVDYEGARLISKFNGSAYKCKVRANMSNDFNSSVRYCRVPGEKTNCSNADAVTEAKYVYTVDLTEPRLPKINHCEHSALPTMDPRFKKYVGCVDTQPAPEQPDVCFFQKDGKDCLVNTNYAIGRGFEYRADNKSVYVYNWQAEFPFGEWSLKDDQTVYVCGTFIPMSDEKNFEVLLEVLTDRLLITLSMLFLLIFLMISANKENLQGLPNKLIFSLCLTLFLFYALYLIAQILPSCRVASIFIHYLCLSFYAWLLIASYDFWSVICCSSSKLEALVGQTQLRRYLIYSFFGWILPMPLVAIAVDFDLADAKKIPCTWKPGYGRLGKCFISQQTAKSYFFSYPSSVIFCIIILFFTYSSYHIYRSKRKNTESKAKNYYYILFAKLAIITSSTWMLGMLAEFTDSMFLKFLHVLLNSSQGIFMFSAYEFKKHNKFIKCPCISFIDRIEVRNRYNSLSSTHSSMQMM